MSAREVSPAQMQDIVPSWVHDLLKAGRGESDPYVRASVAARYVPGTRTVFYRSLHRYEARIAAARKRSGYLLPVDTLLARPDEIPCERVGQSFYVPKRLLIIKLLGYLPTSLERQP
jgi:hypothetical protein